MKSQCLILLCISLILLTSCNSTKKNKEGNIKVNKETSFIESGKIWKDTNGKKINAHGGGILYHNDTYYWFGEIKKEKTWLVSDESWECYRTDAGGVSCYSSKNLIDWKYEGVAMAPNLSDPTSDIHFSKVIERPKVVYNEKTKKFVMWMHIDSEDYSYARAGVAISDDVTGPYKFLYSMRPNNQMSRDMTLFKDDDGIVYHIYSSENNETMHINQLTDDYLKPTDTFVRIFEKESREAPAMFKHNGKYYLITSGCTGWSPNAASYAVADAIQGPWRTIGNPCIGKDAEFTFFAQSTYVIPVKGKKDAYIFMSDIWNKTDLDDSKYLWLPIKINDDQISIDWLDKWNLSVFNQ